MLIRPIVITNIDWMWPLKSLLPVRSQDLYRQVERVVCLRFTNEYGSFNMQLQRVRLYHFNVAVTNKSTHLFCNVNPNKSSKPYTASRFWWNHHHIVVGVVRQENCRFRYHVESLVERVCANKGGQEWKVCRVCVPSQGLSILVAFVCLYPLFACISNWLGACFDSFWRRQVPRWQNKCHKYMYIYKSISHSLRLWRDDGRHTKYQ